MRGYLHDPEQTEQVLVEEGGRIWYRTGDLFSMDDEGFLAFHGRVGRQFKLRNGEFVNPEALERIFARVSLVEHVLVYGDQQRDYPLPLVTVDVEEAKRAALTGCRWRTRPPCARIRAWASGSAKDSLPRPRPPACRTTSGRSASRSCPSH